MQQYNLRLPPEHLERVRAAAERAGETVSEAMRKAHEFAFGQSGFNVVFPAASGRLEVALR